MKNLRDEFLGKTTDWEEKLNEDEWFFSKLEEELTFGLTAEECFNLIPQIVQLTMEQRNEYLCLMSFELLFTLSRKSRTTEIPVLLEANWDQLINHVSGFSDYHKNQVKEFALWYRKK
ncbi:hypothetical protein [Ammoniphilus sp. 3BR4]|uniref:hypothetical protein n=1 Tax=Ammoniphilus sp. 3BR4 TaxID=3158265 RepID=UPI0034676385